MRRQLLVGLAVELGQPAFARQLCRRLLEYRREGFARPAPIRPDIYQQRQVALDLAGVVALFQFERLVQQHLAFAAPAFGLVAQALGGDAVQPIAMGAGDQQWIGHEGAPGQVVNALDLESVGRFIKLSHALIHLCAATVCSVLGWREAMLRAIGPRAYIATCDKLPHPLGCYSSMR
ncbi:hypothetical protein EMIT0196P_40244 [Pseudomonas chlororaphis]